MNIMARAVCGSADDKRTGLNLINRPYQLIREGIAKKHKRSNFHSALLRLTEAQAKLGAVQNRFNHKMTFLSGGLLNVSVAKSCIVDADFAAQSARMARLSILESAVSDMLMKSNEQKKMVLDLLEVM